MKKNLIPVLFLILLFCHFQPAFANNASPTTIKPYSKAQNQNYQTKNIFAKKIDQVLPEPHASLLSGMLFGIKSTMPKDFYQALKTTGTLHIVVLSGYNISIILAAVFVLFVPLIGRRFSSLLAIVSIIGFIAFVGPNPPVVRAAIMGILSLVSLYFGRPKTAIYLLILTGAIMVAFDKTMITSLSFQLSFAATLGIILFASQPSKKKTKSFKNILIQSLKEELSVTLSAQVFTIPIILYSFGTLSLISPLANLAVVWTVPIITNLGLIASLALVIIPPLGKLLTWICFSFLSCFIYLVKLASLIPFAQLQFDKIPLYFYFLYALLITFILYLKAKNIKFKFSFKSPASTHSGATQPKAHKATLPAGRDSSVPKSLKISPKLLFLSFISIFVILFLSIAILSAKIGQKPKIVFCDVGQGDAILILTSQNHKVLVDGGPDSKVLNCLSRHLPFYDRKIDFVILTHPQKDHIAGLIPVLDRYIVTYLLVENQAVNSNQFKAFQALVRQKNLKIINPKKGDQIKIDDLVLTFFWPEKSFTDKNLWSQDLNTNILSAFTFQGLDPNDLSIVTLVSTQDNLDILLTGDISSYILDQLIADIITATKDKKLEILKFPHHGSKTGLSTAFLYQTKPEKTIISVGKNRFGHPDPRVINALEKINTQILRTDKKGNIEITLE